MMKTAKIVSYGSTKLAKQEAEAVAEANQKHDPDWTYTAIQLKGGWWIVEIRDEEGEFLGYL